MSSPGTEEAAGLNEPLLANGNNGVDEAEVAKRKGALKSKDDNWCWEDVGQPDDVAAPPDLENGDGRRPLLFRNRKVKNIVLYPFR